MSDENKNTSNKKETPPPPPPKPVKPKRIYENFSVDKNKNDKKK